MIAWPLERGADGRLRCGRSTEVASERPVVAKLRHVTQFLSTGTVSRRYEQPRALESPHRRSRVGRPR